MGIAINAQQTLKRVVGNIEAIGAVLQDNSGATVDLTDRSVAFRLVRVNDGSVKVDSAVATVVDAEAGRVSYAPADADVDTVGLYAMYWIVDSTPETRFPYDGRTMQLLLLDEAGNQE